jgi:hypothetical protein
MSIYRGAGGSGDATADASSEALLVKQLAIEAQVDADAAAASASAASSSASSASSSAASAAASASSIDVTSLLQKSSNLSDLASASTARTNLGLGTAATTASTAYATAAQGTTADTAYADRLKWDGGATGLTAATGRTSLGLGTIATQAANAVAITGGSVTGITDLAVADGGTGASTATDARTNLGAQETLVSGTNLKTLNGSTLLGSGNLTVATSSTLLKNRIINGAMYLAQRATSGTSGSAAPTTSPATYPSLDRWFAYATGATVTVAQVAGANANRNLLRASGAASVTAVGIGQRIEALNSYDLAGQTVTLSAYIANSLLTTVTWTAYYAGSTDTWTSQTQIATGTFTVTSTLTQYNAQISIPSAATTGISIVFTVGAQTSGTWDIGLVQLEVGSSATGFEYRQYGQELALCQRYYTFTATAIYGGLSSPNGQGNVQWFYNTTMRIAPQVTGNAATTVVTSTANFAAGVTNNTGGYLASFASGSTASAEL